MTTRDIIKLHKTICDQATSFRLFEALENIETILKSLKIEEFHTEYESISSNYQILLSYTIKGIKDPQRSQVLSSLIISIIELADKIKEHYLEENNLQLSQNKKNSFNKLSLIQKKFSETVSSKEYAQKINDVLSETNIKVDTSEDDKKHETFRNDLFDFVLYADKFSDSDILFLKKVFSSDYFGWYDNCLLVTSVTLSLIRFFDTTKMELLFDFYYSGRHEIRQRALVGILLCLYIYDDRIRFYKALNDRINKIYADNELSESDVLYIIKQFVRAKDTEKITKRMKDEIIPDIQKLTPRLEDKLDLKNILSDDPSADKNPDWQSILEDSPELFDKIEELSKMQLEGNDVFMSTFSLLKHFDFFEKVANWFLPFYKENQEVQKIMSEEGPEAARGFIELLEKSTYMCNSDKYSFILNLKMMPEQQKSMLLNLFSSELEGMNELAEEDEILNKAKVNNTVYTQYIQDLYRFFKLHPTKYDFDDFFDLKLDFHNKHFINSIFRAGNFKMKIADYYFNTDHYPEALDVFLGIQKSEKPDMDILQKTGYCYQRIGNYSQALEYYLKAELFDSSNTWLLKKIALCYSKINDFKKSITYYLDIEKLEPENMNIVMNIANCYLNLKDYSKALHYYYKIEFRFRENKGIYRPIAWCLFVSGDFAKARDYFTRLIDNGMANKYDYMNYGHVQWVAGKREEASELYYKSIIQPDNNYEGFYKGFRDDESYLLKHGIEAEEIQLMLDHLLYRIKNNN